MHRAIPVVNKTCADRARQKEQELHKSRLKTMRPRIDTGTPPVQHMEHIRNNLKREQLQEERYHDIDRANRILLAKMSDIMKQTTPFNTNARRAASTPPSLNEGARTRELRRITEANQGILQRIRKAQPVYNHVEWEDSHKKNENYLRNSSEYSVVLPRKRASRPPSGSGFRAVQDRGQESAGNTQDGGSAASNGEEDLRYVLKEGKELNHRYYLVEMATDGRTLAISAYDGDQQRTLELLVNERNHRRLYRDAGGDYSAIASRLRVEGDQLRLLPSSGAGPFETS